MFKLTWYVMLLSIQIFRAIFYCPKLNFSCGHDLRIKILRKYQEITTQNHVGLVNCGENDLACC